MKKEIEAKFLSINKDSVRTKLKKIGFTLKIPEYLMRRKTFDFSRVAPGRNKWGRVRQEYDKVTMTIKEVRGSGINDTYEIELTVNNFEAATAFFEACNISAKAFQENMREVWSRNKIEATIDTWPGLNPFLEIEGENEKAIKEISSELDFNFEEAVFGSIDLVYEKEIGIQVLYRQKSPLRKDSPCGILRNLRLPEITFANSPKENGA